VIVRPPGKPVEAYRIEAETPGAAVASESNNQQSQDGNH
jgi:hypothetical protein